MNGGSIAATWPLTVTGDLETDVDPLADLHVAHGADGEDEPGAARGRPTPRCLKRIDTGQAWRQLTVELRAQAGSYLIRFDRPFSYLLPFRCADRAGELREHAAARVP